MAKYQWKSAELKRKANMYDWLMFLFVIITGLVALLHLTFFPVFVLPFVVAVVFYVLAWMTKSKDTKLKAKGKQ